MTTPFNTISIIGAGLIGGSIARAASKRNASKKIILCDSNELSLAYATAQGFADETTIDPQYAASKADLVILATPTSTLADIMPKIGPTLQPETILLDVCSVKRRAMEIITPHINDTVDYIPAHPIAGSEKTGINASHADLFYKKRVILTPENPAVTLPFTKICNFWELLGAQTEAMPAHIHDKVYAYVSHLPHVLAFAAANTLNPFLLEDTIPESLQRFLRLSESSMELWMDIFLQNQDNLTIALDRYLDAIMHICSELEKPPEDTLPPETEEDAILARHELFPRIAAACLITTVMEAEKQNGFPFSRYAGMGFLDFIYPASNSPEEGMEMVSSQHKAVHSLMLAYANNIRHFRDVIAQEAAA